MHVAIGQLGPRCTPDNGDDSHRVSATTVAALGLRKIHATATLGVAVRSVILSEHAALMPRTGKDTYLGRRNMVPSTLGLSAQYPTPHAATRKKQQVYDSRFDG